MSASDKLTKLKAATGLPVDDSGLVRVVQGVGNGGGDGDGLCDRQWAFVA